MVANIKGPRNRVGSDDWFGVGGRRPMRNAASFFSVEVTTLRPRRLRRSPTNPKDEVRASARRLTLSLPDRPLLSSAALARRRSETASLSSSLFLPNVTDEPRARAWSRPFRNTNDDERRSRSRKTGQASALALAPGSAFGENAAYTVRRCFGSGTKSRRG